MRLFHYLKEVRSWCRVGQIVSGALRLQRASVLPVRCSALCCCAPRRTVLAMNFEPAHHLLRMGRTRRSTQVDSTLPLL